MYVLHDGHCVKCWDYSGEYNKYAPHGAHCLIDIMVLLMPEKKFLGVGGWYGDGNVMLF